MSASKRLGSRRTIALSIFDPHENFNQGKIPWTKRRRINKATHVNAVTALNITDETRSAIELELRTSPVIAPRQVFLCSVNTMRYTHTCDLTKSIPQIKMSLQPIVVDV